MNYISTTMRCLCKESVGHYQSYTATPLLSHGEMQHHNRVAKSERVKNYFAVNFCHPAHTLLATVGKYVHQCHHN